MSTILCPICTSPALETLTRCPTCGSALHLNLPDTVLTPGSTLRGGQYRIDGILGQGGFGITYRAWDTGLSSAVALKELFPMGVVSRGVGQTVQVLSGSLAADYAKLKTGAFQEARTLYALRDPAVVQVLSVWEENNSVYLAMELLEGETLQTRLERGNLAEPEATAQLRVLLAALEKVHVAGVLHRDLKPDNIMLSPKYGPVLIDFGTAHAFEMGKTMQFSSRVLTPAYAPLEQYASSARVGPYSDVYALAVSFYQALTGTLPPCATDQILGAPVIPLSSLRPDLPLGFVFPLETAMALHIKDRPQTAAAWLSMLPAPQHIPAPSSMSGQAATVHIPQNNPKNNPTQAPAPSSTPTLRVPLPHNSSHNASQAGSRGWMGGLLLGLGVSGLVAGGAYFLLRNSKNDNPAPVQVVAARAVIIPPTVSPKPVPQAVLKPSQPKPEPPQVQPVLTALDLARINHPHAFVGNVPLEPGLPAPAFVKIILEPLPLRVGVPARMSVQAVNSGEYAPAGSLSISFPGAYPLDVGSLELLDQTALWKVERLLPGRKIMVLGYSKIQMSRDTLFEGYVDALHGGWPSGQDKEIALGFTPVRAGTLRIFVRATASMHGGIQPQFHRSAPLSSDTQDQQGFSVLPLEFEVLP